MFDLVIFIAKMFEFVPAFITVASVITAITPTPQDDKAWAKIYKYVELLALNIGKAKEKNETTGK